MTPIIIQTQFSIQALRATQLIFDDSDLVSLEVECRLEKEVCKTTLLFTFSLFNDFLRHTGTLGLALQDILCDKLLGSEQPPYIINLNERPLVFTNCKLELSYLIAGDLSCLSVEGIKPLSFLQQAQNLKSNIRDFGLLQLEQQHVIKQALHDIASQYHYYEGLKSLDVIDIVARERAGLLNDKIFKIAYYASKR